MAYVANAYRRLLLSRPKSALVALALLLAFFAYHAKDFRLDASADSLVLEDDRDLQLSRQVSARYQTRDLLVVTFSPQDDLFSDASLALLKNLRDELGAVGGVHSVVSILDVPLVKSSEVPLAELAENVPTLENETIDREHARQELSQSPVFRDLVISRDQRTTAILIQLTRDENASVLLTARNELLIARGSRGLDPAEQRRFAEVSAAYEEARAPLDAQRHRIIGEVRDIIAGYEESAVLHLGGVPMIADDMLSFVRGDLIVFGTAVTIFLVVVLGVIFRRIRWVVLPLLSCLYALVIMIGALGLIGWKVTVISSNFLSLMLIITISMNIHLAVRYRQLRADQPDAAHVDLVDTTLRKLVWPCLYTALTTIIGFSSLVFSGIKPVIDFGWMMSVGLGVAFLTSFTLFPTVLLFLGAPAGAPAPGPARGARLTKRLASLTERHGGAIFAVTAFLAILSGVGISRLTVENSFIDYFSKNTEIYRGMKLIDEQLGGTTPLEVLLDFAPVEEPDSAEEEGDDAYEEDLEDWTIDVADGPEYWFTPFKIDRIKEVHDYLEGLPEVGKVLSLASIIRVAEDLNDGEEFSGIELSVLYKKLPEEIVTELIHPYVSFEHDEARILLRILDSREGLRRADLLARIEDGLRSQLGLTEDDVQITGTLVLYNNMLQSLVRSQIASLAAVLVGIALMLLLLFRSLPLAVIGIVPNLLAAGVVLGIMGLLGIPLDMMTITIAAITIGIAVDNAIHYIYRFREELSQTGDYIGTLHICHTNIGRAVLYTSTTIIFGFSILALSNFFPTIYFGLLTGLAMLMALLAALTLLPRLILLWKPFGPAHVEKLQKP